MRVTCPSSILHTFNQPIKARPSPPPRRLIFSLFYKIRTIINSNFVSIQQQQQQQRNMRQQQQQQPIGFPLYLFLVLIIFNCPTIFASSSSSSSSSSSVSNSPNNNYTCPFPCLLNEIGEVICLEDYSKPIPHPSKPIACELRPTTTTTTINGNESYALTLGNGESVRSIKNYIFWPLFRKLDQLAIQRVYINLDTIHLSSGTFIGLQETVEEIRIYHALAIDPKSFYYMLKLKRLFIERVITGSQPTSYLLISAINIDHKLTTSVPVTCHRCKQHDIDYRGRVVLVLVPQIHQSSTNVLELLEAKQCPIQKDGVGCQQENKNPSINLLKSTSKSKTIAITTTITTLYNSSSSTASNKHQTSSTKRVINRNNDNDKRGYVLPLISPPTTLKTLPSKTNNNNNNNNDNHNNNVMNSFVIEALLPLSVVLSLWCTFLTFIVIVILVIVWRRFRLVKRMYDHHTGGNVIITDTYSFTDPRLTTTPLSTRHFNMENEWLTRDSRKASSSTILT